MLKSIRSRTVAAFLIVAIISLGMTALVSFLFLSAYTEDLDTTALREGTVAAAENIERARNLLPPEEGEGIEGAEEERRFRNLLNVWLNSQANVLDAKLVVSDGEGRVVAESLNPPDYSRRGIVLPTQFLPDRGLRVAVRTVPGLEREYLYVSVPLSVGMVRDGFLVSLKPARDIGAAAATYTRYVVFAALIALGLSLILAVLMGETIARPIRELTRAARRMAGGDYGARVESRRGDEIGELGEDFNRMAERVGSTYQMQRDFVGNVSHELRTPLTSIEGFSQALVDGTVRGEAEVQRALEVIREESGKMKHILNDLLLLSQIDAGQLESEVENVSIAALLERLGELFEQRARSENIDFQVDVPEDDEYVEADRNRLDQVLSNLLENAFKYTPAGGRIVLSAARLGTGEMSISVADTGSGISAEDLPNVFDRFYRAEKSRDKRLGGVGLGLSLCKELTETMGGRIIVRSAPGQGTTFTVSLPGSGDVK